MELDFDAYRRYMCARGYARGTVWSRLAVAREWVGRHPALTASHRDVERWMADKALTPGSTRNLLVALRALYRFAQREGLATHDPTSLADRPPVPARLPRPAPEHDIARLFETVDVQLQAIVALMACAGLRCIEASRLNWCDVDIPAATIIVMGKNSKERMIDVSPDVVRALAALRLATARTVGAVFVGPTGRRLTPARISQRVNRAFTALGSHTTAHQLRHRCATQALQQPGVDLLAVRDLLGHASVSHNSGLHRRHPGPHRGSIPGFNPSGRLRKETQSMNITNARTLDALRDLGCIADEKVDMKALAKVLAHELEESHIAGSLDDVATVQATVGQLAGTLVGHEDPEFIEMLRPLLSSGHNGKVQQALSNGYMLCAGRVKIDINIEGEVKHASVTTRFLSADHEVLEHFVLEPRINRAENLAKSAIAMRGSPPVNPT